MYHLFLQRVQSGEWTVGRGHRGYDVWGLGICAVDGFSLVNQEHSAASNLEVALLISALSCNLFASGPPV